MKIFKLLTLSSLIVLAACSKVPAGNVGVKVHLLGGDKGIDTEVLTPGLYWIGMNEDLFLFPTFTQNYEFPSMRFQTVEGLSVSGKVGISYQIEPSKVPLIFQKYRKGIEEITSIYLGNQIRDALVITAGEMKIDDVYGRQKAKIMERVQTIVSANVSPLGIQIEKIYWVGDLDLPKNVTIALNAKIEAIQKTQQRENEVAQSRAEAQKKIEEARGEAESLMLIARAQADAIKLKAEALKANDMLLEYTSIEKWDGKLPVYAGTAVPFINLENKR